MLRRNAAPGICDRNPALAVVALERDGDLAALRSEAKGIGDEIDQRPAKENRLGVDVALALTFEIDPLILRNRFVKLTDFFDRLTAIKLPGVE